MPMNHKPEAPQNGQTPARKRRTHAWVWYFVVLAILAVSAVALLWIYNLGQQLTPKRLAEARKLWNEKRPLNYVLSHTREGSTSGTFVVSVRNGQVQSVVMKQEVRENGGVKTVSTPLKERFYPKYDMTGLFDDLQGFLDLRLDPTRGRAFLVAKFDPDDGHVTGYTYSNSTMGQRVKVVVQLQKKDEG